MASKAKDAPERNANNHLLDHYREDGTPVYTDPVSGGMYSDQAQLDKLRALDSGTTTTVARQESRAFNEVSIMDPSLFASFEDAVAAFEEMGITVDTADSTTVGDGFTAIDKAELINRKCLFITWHLDSGANRIGDRGFLIIRGVTQDGIRFRITDGSTGLAQELRELSTKRTKAGQTGANAGLILPRGLKGDLVEGDTEDGTHYKTTIYRCAV